MFLARSGIGKSLIATNIIANNPDARLLFFSLEMPAHMVLMRLWSHWSNRPHDEIFNLVYSNRIPDEVFDIHAAFPYLIIVDEPALSLDEMTIAIEEYERNFGAKPDAVIIDYLEEIGGSKSSGEGWVRTEATASSLKVWSRQQHIGVYILHQSNMKTEPWEPPIQSSAKGGGYTESDVVVGLWKPGKNPDLTSVTREATRNDLHMNVIKNRVTGHLEDELRFVITQSMMIKGLYDRQDATLFAGV
jgi:replicative DNA helicase